MAEAILRAIEQNGKQTNEGFQKMDTLVSNLSARVSDLEGREASRNSSQSMQQTILTQTPPASIRNPYSVNTNTEIDVPKVS